MNTKDVPAPIWAIAITCWTFTFVTTAHLWMGSSAEAVGAPGGGVGLLLKTALASGPGALGYWLIKGRRWVRWLFPLLVLAALLVVMGQVLCPGLGPDADEANCSHSVWPAVYLLATLVMTIAVFIYTWKPAYPSD
ncbi:hypothetical protein [Roseateles sp. P5_E4]